MGMQKPKRQFADNVGLQFLIVILVAGGFFLVCWLSGSASDCSGTQADGQCGLSSFLGLLYGVMGALAIIVVSSFVIAIVQWRRR
jgi:hypothetical protein